MFKHFEKNKNEGQVVILTAMCSLVIAVLIIMVISSPVVSQLKMNKNLFKTKTSYFISESGNEDIVYRIKNGENITGQENLSFVEGLAQTTITVIGSGVKEVLTVGDVNNRIRKIKTKIQTTSGVSFNYGLFTGQGGIEMENNTRINGSVYSNGSIEGANNVTIAGDVYVAPRPATRIRTEREKTSDEWGILFRNLFLFDRLQMRDFTGMIISCVVPPVLNMLGGKAEKYFHVAPLWGRRSTSACPSYMSPCRSGGRQDCQCGGCRLRGLGLSVFQTVNANGQVAVERDITNLRCVPPL